MREHIRVYIRTHVHITYVADVSQNCVTLKRAGKAKAIDNLRRKKGRPSSKTRDSLEKNSGYSLVWKVRGKKGVLK